MSEADSIFVELLKANLVTKVYDPQLNKNSFALTPKGADWYRTLASLFAVPKKSKKSYFDKIAKKVNKNSPEKIKKETVNKYMNKVIDGLEGVAKFGQQIDKQTGGAPKLNSFQRGDLFSDPSQVRVKKSKKRHGKTKSKR
tara:strand:- start:444 stop:866 length:423 start_codon:yes stop_codon:yes gene_type:complete